METKKHKDFSASEAKHLKTLETENARFKKLLAKRESAIYVKKRGLPARYKLRFIEVKGRVSDAPTVTITRNEILCAFNKPDDWNLALVEVPV